MSLIAVYSEDIESNQPGGGHRRRYGVTVTGRPDAKLEKIVTKLGIEPGFFAVSWKIVSTTEVERELVSEA